VIQTKVARLPAITGVWTQLSASLLHLKVPCRIAHLRTSAGGTSSGATMADWTLSFWNIIPSKSGATEETPFDR
jgi:hypothetical protein